MYHLLHCTSHTLVWSKSPHDTHHLYTLLCTGSYWEGFYKQSSVLVYIFYEVCASGMVCGIISGMCKILYRTTYPTSVPYQLMPYMPWSRWWLYYLCLQSYKSLNETVIFLIFNTVGCWFLVCFVTLHLLLSLFSLSLWLYSLNVYKIISTQHF